MLVSFIVPRLLPEEPALADADRVAAAAAAVGFVKRALGLAPLHVRFGVAILSFPLALWIGVFGVNAKSLRTFQSLSAPTAAVLRAYRSLGAVAFFEHPAVAAAIGVDETPEQRRRAFQERRQALHPQA